MIQRSFLAFWLCAWSLSSDCPAQTVQEILQKTSRVMEPPIKYRLSANGKSCTVLQKRMDDESIAIRMEFASPASLIRIETNSASFEVYPNSKLVIDVGFMGTICRSQIADVLGLLDRSHPLTALETELVAQAEFEGKQCWKVSYSSPVPLTSLTPTRVNQNETPKETVAYIDALSYQLVGMETFTNPGQTLVQTKISNIEKPNELSNDLFLPPADFAMHKPHSIVEYLSARESLVAAQVLAKMKDDISARQLQTKNMTATLMAKAAVARRSSSRLNYYLPIFMVCLVAFVILTTIWSHRRATNRWKQMTLDPALANTELAKMTEAASLSSWTRFSRAPLVLKAFVIYVVCAMVVGLTLPFFLPSIYATGGAFRFLVPLFMIHTALSRLEFRRSVYAVVALLAFYGALSTFQFLTIQSLGSTGFSSTRYGSTNLVFEVVMPIAWAFLLMSPSMQKWLRAKSSDEAQVHQVLMADLLYFMLVAGLAMTASMALIRRLN